MDVPRPISSRSNVRPFNRSLEPVPHIPATIERREASVRTLHSSRPHVLGAEYVRSARGNLCGGGRATGFPAAASAGFPCPRLCADSSARRLSDGQDSGSGTGLIDADEGASPQRVFELPEDRHHHRPQM